MLGQIDVFGKTKLEKTLEKIKAFEPEEGYYLAFSGGKDSQCIYHLCEMARVKFDAHYRVTSVDPPELVKFIKDQYPDVAREVPRDKEGKPITMWSLISHNKMPPTRVARYCCQKLKESGGDGRVTMTGVRWAESANRKKNQGLVTIVGKTKTTQKQLKDHGVNFTQTERGGVVLNFDDDSARRGVEMCYRTRKTLINPIIDWTDSDVWEFLNDVVKVPHCCLYDEGFKRIGCIGCPMARGEKQTEELNRWPAYRRAYIRAFEKMLAKRLEERDETDWKNGEEVMAWWTGRERRNNE